jgi:hypothetical protein
MTKQVRWTNKPGRALMGNIIEETDKSYVVKVTSCSHSKDAKLVGQKFLVFKDSSVTVTK